MPCKTRQIDLLAPLTGPANLRTKLRLLFGDRGYLFNDYADGPVEGQGPWLQGTVLHTPVGISVDRNFPLSAMSRKRGFARTS